MSGRLIHFRGLLPRNGILPGATFPLRTSLALSHTGSVTARHSSCGRQPNLVAWYKEWNYETFAEGATYIQLGGHHVGHWQHSSSLLVGRLVGWLVGLCPKILDLSLIHI